MKKLVSRRTISPTRKIIRRQPRSPRRLTLSDLPAMLFDQISNEYNVLEETIVELYWTRISIFRYEGLANLTLPYHVQLRRLDMPGEEKVWIGFCKGYITNSFTLCTGEPGTQPLPGGRIAFGPHPFLIIEAGHPLSKDAGPLLDEQSAIRTVLTPVDIADALKHHISQVYREQAKCLSQKRKRNPMRQRFGGRCF